MSESSRNPVGALWERADVTVEASCASGAGTAGRFASLGGTSLGGDGTAVTLVGGEVASAAEGDDVVLTLVVEDAALAAGGTALVEEDTACPAEEGALLVDEADPVPVDVDCVWLEPPEAPRGVRREEGRLGRGRGRPDWSRPWPSRGSCERLEIVCALAQMRREHMHSHHLQPIVL